MRETQDVFFQIKGDSTKSTVLGGLSLDFLSRPTLLETVTVTSFFLL